MTDVTRPAVPLLAGAGRSPGKRRQIHVTGGRKRELESARKEERKKIENERKEEKEDNLPAFFFFS